MQSLKDYLNESPLHCESILDPDQNKVMSRMTDELIPNRIREYCTYDRQKYNRGELWPAADAALKITKIDKDKKGWYIETSGTIDITKCTHSRSFYGYCLSIGQEVDRQKGFLIEDIGIYFRWRRHSEKILIGFAPDFESTDGLPEELDVLSLGGVCHNSKRLDVRNKIRVIVLDDTGDIKISGNGCKDIIINPDSVIGEITAPSGTNIHRPVDYYDYNDLRKKIAGY